MQIRNTTICTKIQRSTNTKKCKLLSIYKILDTTNTKLQIYYNQIHNLQNTNMQNIQHIFIKYTNSFYQIFKLHITQQKQQKKQHKNIKLRKILARIYTTQ